jgi:tRNA C32,U32 (ribose-2'-O)-methylase TrmJ
VSLVVVLVRTQDLVNIAGVVRAMKNFELRDLRLIAPED